MILALRVAKGVGVRQPLRAAAAVVALNIPFEFELIVRDEVNIKELDFVDDLAMRPDFVRDEKSMIAVNFTLNEELRAEGRAREIVREIQELRKQQNLVVSDTIEAIIKTSDENKAALCQFGDEIKKKVAARKISLGISTSITKI